MKLCLRGVRVMLRYDGMGNYKDERREDGDAVDSEFAVFRFVWW